MPLSFLLGELRIRAREPRGRPWLLQHEGVESGSLHFRGRKGIQDKLSVACSPWHTLTPSALMAAWAGFVYWPFHRWAK